MKTTTSTRKYVLIALFGALSAMFMFLKFPLPFMPPFMSFDFTGVIEIIGGLVLGPLAAIQIITVKILLKLMLMGSTSMLTGELQNFMLSCAYVLPAVMIYHHKKGKKAAIVGMTVGTIICAGTAVFTNLVIIIPFFMNLAGMTMADIVAMCTLVNPLITDPFTLAMWGIVPFNLLKNGICSIITVCVYKKISVTLKRYYEELNYAKA